MAMEDSSRVGLLPSQKNGSRSFYDSHDGPGPLDKMDKQYHDGRREQKAGMKGAGRKNGWKDSHMGQDRAASTSSSSKRHSETRKRNYDLDESSGTVFYDWKDEDKPGGSNLASRSSPSHVKEDRDRANGHSDKASWRHKEQGRSERRFEDRSYAQDWKHRDDRDPPSYSRKSRKEERRRDQFQREPIGRSWKRDPTRDDDERQRDRGGKRKSPPSDSRTFHDEKHRGHSKRNRLDPPGHEGGDRRADAKYEDDYRSRSSRKARRSGDFDQGDWDERSGRWHDSTDGRPDRDRHRARSRSTESRRSRKSERRLSDRERSPSERSLAEPSHDKDPPPLTAEELEEKRANREKAVYDATPQKGNPYEGYIRLDQVGEGTYGQVFKAKAGKTGALVAMKKIRMESEKDGFPITAMREIRILQSLRHPNVVRLHEIMVSKASVYMIFEYLEHDLNGVLSNPSIEFQPEHLKSLSKQLLEGLEYLHKKSILHRDIKGSNLLISNSGLLKLADFGLARLYAKRRQEDHTNRVITLWYRPLELLYGETQYGGEVDMWGAGCIFLELFTRKPIFQGSDELHQIQVITDLLGPYTSERWAGVDELPWYGLIESRVDDKGADDAADATLAGASTGSIGFRESFSAHMSPAALDLALQLLDYDPKRRATASKALESPYFTREQPFARIPFEIFDNVQGEWHEYESKRARRKRHQAEQKEKNGTDSAKASASASRVGTPPAAPDITLSVPSGPTL